MITKFRNLIAGVLLTTIVVGGLSGCNSTQKSQKRETGKIEWPEVTGEVKPWTRWWWHGSAVTEKDLTAALEAYKAAGLGGVEITPIYGTRGTEDQFIEFLSPEFMEKLVFTLNEAKRLGLGVDLANASGWPFGGPWVAKEDVAKGIYSKTFKVQGGQILGEKVEFIQSPIVRTQGRKKVTINELKEPVAANDNLQELALDQVRFEKSLPLLVVTASKATTNGFGETIDITDKVKDGKLDWTAPEGEWTICALFQGDHGKMVERAGPGGEGFVIDHFSAEALQNYLSKFDEAFTGYDLSYLRYYFNDSYEVDDAIGEADFTPQLFQAFEKLNQYDLRKQLPALLGLDSEEMNNRVLHDFRKTIDELILTEYTEKWQQWAAAQGKGIRNQSHGSPGNVLDLYAASDVPEIEGNDLINLKAAASAAHISGRNLTASEACTWLDEHFESTLGAAKDAVDDFFFAGVNHVVYHGTVYSPQDAVWPGWLFYAAVHFTPANSFWDDFGALNQYVARAQSFLQAGKPSNDILLYFPISDLWSSQDRGRLAHLNTGNFFDGTGLKACGTELTEKGYSWDAISDRQLQQVTFKGTSFHVGGNPYQAVMIPETHYMPIETLEQLFTLANEGATILFQKSLPQDVAGLGNLQQARDRMKELTGKLMFTDSQGLRVATYGKGKIVISEDLTALATYTKVMPESMYINGFQCIRRVKEDGNYYYLVKNTTEETFDGWIGLNAELASAALYNPMTGEAGYAIIRDNQGVMELYVQMEPGETMAVETFRGKYTGELYPYYKQDGNTRLVLHDWKINFLKGGPSLPVALTTDTLKSWTEFGQEYAIFSGTAEYTTRIPTLPTHADVWLLNLGNVHESASVSINGEEVGTLIHAPYCIEIPGHLLKGDDELKIKVSNLMANRIIDLDKRGVEWKIFYNTNINARKRPNAGADGKFTAAHWEPKPSGLSGNVTLSALSRIQ